MTTINASISGVLPLTRVKNQLTHVLAHCEIDEPSGTSTGLACPTPARTRRRRRHWSK